jgi:hypothetical protein
MREGTFFFLGFRPHPPTMVSLQAPCAGYSAAHLNSSDLLIATLLVRWTAAHLPNGVFQNVTPLPRAAVQDVCSMKIGTTAILLVLLCRFCSNYRKRCAPANFGASLHRWANHTLGSPNMRTPPLPLLMCKEPPPDVYRAL